MRTMTGLQKKVEELNSGMESDEATAIEGWVRRAEALDLMFSELDLGSILRNAYEYLLTVEEGDRQFAIKAVSSNIHNELVKLGVNQCHTVPGSLTLVPYGNIWAMQMSQKASMD
jgi:hypothetical protein